MTDEMKSALMYELTRTLADLFAVTLKLTAQLHPEIVREAFASVIPLASVEEMARRAVSVSTEAQETASAAYADVRAIQEAAGQDTADMEKRQDQLLHGQEELLKEQKRLEQRVQKGHQAVSDLAKQFNQKVKR